MRHPPPRGQEPMAEYTPNELMRALQNGSPATVDGNDVESPQLTPRQELMLLRFTNLKLKRNIEQIDQLKATLAQSRIYSSSRSLNIINYTQNHPDYLISSLWGPIPDDQNQFKKFANRSSHAHSDRDSDSCCVIM